MSRVMIIIGRSDYADLISILDHRIRSERARRAAYHGKRDHAQAHAADGRRERLVCLRNALVEGCQAKEVDDA